MDERLSVGAMMNGAPYSIGEDETVLMAWEVVERSGQSHLPVVRQDGSCAGLLERAELAVACADPTVTLSRRSVRDLVRGRRTVTVHPEEPALRAAAVMTEEHRDALPVTDPHGRLTGLLTAQDYVAAAAGLRRTAGPARQAPHLRATLPGLPPRRREEACGIPIP
ncbi:CBS domain-containing protein [Streptomyces tricolor]|uniref:CBS domain-containing protein n=1 Tax=Streptomyces tricolor TaxID=68277 RepID=A0ABS9J903_9ACTN|nr:CBS domain-containing protein [Streptomyces tricolor]MCG0062051.1 CBS domain-containing protein [Streptomyces tricolor]